MREKTAFWNGVERIQWGCALMRLLGEQDLTHLHLVLAGYRSVDRSRQVTPFVQAVRTARILLGDLLTRQAVQNAVYVYNEAAERDDPDDVSSKAQNRSFRIDPKTLSFSSVYEEGLDSTVADAVAVLQQGLPRRANTRRQADTSVDLIAALGAENEVPLRLGGLQFPAFRQHDLTRRPRQSITITRADLADCAQALDEEDRVAGCPGESWSARLDAIDLQKTTGGGLQPAEALDLNGLKHLIGIPGAGKTTLIMLLCVYLARQGRRVAVFFTSIEVANQYLEKLRRYQVSAAILMGRSGSTHRRHANEMAELIAAEGNGGFGHTREGVELFATRCPLPAFAENLPTQQWLERWPLNEAPCESLREPESPSDCLCPAWELCGRVTNQRALVTAQVWLGHVLSADTPTPAHTSAERMRYFELIADIFDLIIIDECDATQNALDERGAVTLNLTGNEHSLHLQLQKMSGLLAANRMHITDGVLGYAQRANEFERHALRFVAEIRRLTKGPHTQRLARKYSDQLLTAHYLLDEALRAAGVSEEFGRQRLSAISDFWEGAMYHAYFVRVPDDTGWRRAEKYAPDLGISVEEANSRWRRLNWALVRYLALDHAAEGDEIIEDITGELVALMGASPDAAERVRTCVRLLVVVGFVVASYQQLAKAAHPLARRGEVLGEEQSMFFSSVSREMREHVPRSLVGAFSAVRFRQTPDGPGYEIDYLIMDLAPRLLLHRLHELGRASVLLASATSWLEPSSEFHVEKRPDYVLRPSRTLQDGPRGDVRLYVQAQRHPATGEPLYFSGSGSDRDENLRHIVTGLAQPDVDNLSELERAARAMVTPHGRRRKVALIVNSYEQVQLVVERLHEVNPTLGKRTRGVLRDAPEGAMRARYTLRGQVEEIGRQDDVEVVVFPISALGRGINIVYHSADEDDGRGAVGSVYFLTRPHPAAGDLGLMTSLLARDTLAFDRADFHQLSLAEVRRLYDADRYKAYRRVANLLARPMAASRLDNETLKNFAANLLVPILQTIGRGMRKGMPVRVYFVDAAWAPNSALDRAETERSSLLVIMRAILRDCLANSDPDLREVYQALYGVFRDAFDDIAGLHLPETSPNAESDARFEARDVLDAYDEYFDPSVDTSTLDFEGYDPDFGDDLTSDCVGGASEGANDIVADEDAEADGGLDG